MQPNQELLAQQIQMLRKKWIREYKKREKKGHEFYFIATDENDNEFANNLLEKNRKFFY